MKRAILLLAGLAAMLGTPALAGTGNSATMSGTVRAKVVLPIAIRSIADMKFGNITQPATAGTLVLTPAGTVTTTGGVAQSMPQTGGGPKAAEFRIDTATGTQFTIVAPSSFAISNGPASMTVNQITTTRQVQSSNVNQTIYRLNVGATLNVSAGQSGGTYSGTFSLITVYQ